MKLAKIGLVIITSLAVMFSVYLPVQANDESGSVDLSATVALAISDVSASGIGYSDATISWKTNGDATSRVFYDTDFRADIADYADTIEDTALVSEHSIPLTGLSSSTTYHYRVRSAAVIDGSDFIAISEDYTFTTLTPAGGGGGGFVPPLGPPPGTTDVRGIVTTAGVFTEHFTITSESGCCTLDIPEGTVGLNEELEPIDEITLGPMDEPPPPPEDAHIIGLGCDFQPSGATFDPPITLTFSYDLNDIPEGVAEEDLVLAYYDEATGEWIELVGVVDTVNNTITASVTHFTTFAIIGSVPEPAEEEEEPTAVSPVGEQEEEEEVVEQEPVGEQEEEEPVGEQEEEEEEEPTGVSPVGEEEEEEEAKPGVNWPLRGGMIAAVILAGLVVLFWWRRRAKVTKQ